MTGVSEADAQLLSKLFDKAVAGVSNATIGKISNSGKAFEVYALAVVLRLLRRHGYKIICKNCKSGVLVFPGGPSLPNPSKHTHFEARRGSETLYVWLNVEVLTLSHDLAGNSALPSQASFHELDLSIFDVPLPSGKRPSHKNLVFAATCKYASASKAHLREALGFRRETAVLTGSSLPSRAPWFVSSLAADPATPIVLFSRDPAIANFAAPIDVYGLYVRRLSYVL